MKGLIVVRKPIKGCYGAQISIQGRKEQEVAFHQVCIAMKEEAGFIQSNDTTYEFLPTSQEKVKETAFIIAEHLKLSVLFSID